jgi:hypothetical protein
MGDSGKTIPSTPAERLEVHNEAAGADKKKNLDEMIEEFKRDNPVKNQKKIYR